MSKLGEVGAGHWPQETILRGWFCGGHQYIEAMKSQPLQQFLETFSGVKNHSLRVKTYLETLKWVALPFPLYSPDIYPSDKHLFRPMTYSLKKQHFRTYDEAKKLITSWIASQDEPFHRHGIRMLSEIWAKCG